MVNVTDKGYLGNPHLKNTGEEIGWTPTMVQEYMKCAGDPVYFAENYFKIVSVDTGFIPIVLYDYQKDIIRSMTENRKLAVCTARQSGKCFSINTNIRVRNKKTGKIEDISVGQFHEKVKKINAQNDNL